MKTSVASLLILATCLLSLSAAFGLGSNGPSRVLHANKNALTGTIPYKSFALTSLELDDNLLTHWIDFDAQKHSDELDLSQSRQQPTRFDTFR